MAEAQASARRIVPRLALLLGLGLIFWLGSRAMPHGLQAIRQVRLQEMNVEVGRIETAFAHGFPYPAESGARSTPEYLDQLIEAGFLKPGDRLFFKQWVIANLSKNDPKDLVFLASKSYYAYRVLGKSDAKGFGFFHLGGKSFSYGDAPSETEEKLPERSPALLPP